MKNKIFTNFIYQGLYQLTMIVLPFITIPIVSHALGVEGIGTYNYINSVSSYFILVAGLGLANYGVREIASVKDDKQTLSEKFWTLEIFNVIIALIVIFFYLIFIQFTTEKTLFIISGITVIATLFDISWFYYGIQDFKDITKINIITKVISFVCIIVFVKNKSDLYNYFVIQSISVLLSNLTLWFFVFKKINFVKVKISKSMMHLKPALEYFVGKVSITLYTTVNKTLLGYFISATAVGVYSNSLQLILIIVTLLGTIDTVLMPHMTSLYSSDNQGAMMEILTKIINGQLYFSIALMFGILSISDKMVPWFFGPQFEQVSLVMSVFAPLVIIMPLGTTIVRQYLIPRNYIKNFNKSVVVAAIVSIIINIILLPLIGIWGSIIATIVSEAIVTIIRIIDLKINSNFNFDMNSIFCYFVSGVIMLISIKMITIKMPGTSVTTFIQIIIGSVVYLILTTISKKNVILNYLKKDN